MTTLECPIIIENHVVKLYKQYKMALTVSSPVKKGFNLQTSSLRFETPWLLSSVYEKSHSSYSLDYHLYFRKHNIKCCIKQTI